MLRSMYTFCEFLEDPLDILADVTFAGWLPRMPFKDAPVVRHY